MKKGIRQHVAPNQWICSILDALYMFHGKMDSPPMPFSIARSAIFRHGRATSLFYSEMEDNNLCSIRKIEDSNFKISKVAHFLFEENDQMEKHDVCRCISTSLPAKDEVTSANGSPQRVPASSQAQDASIAYFSNSKDLCDYIKASAFSGVVQHVSADCGPEICENRYRMMKSSWYRQTISTEMKINIHRASSEQPVHEKFCTFDGPMHLVETYPTCSKTLNAKIASFVKTIKNSVNAYIPLSYEIWNGEFYLNHSRAGVLRFEFASFIQIVAKQHFSSLETVDQLIPKQIHLRSSSAASSLINAQNLTRPQSASSAATFSHQSSENGLRVKTDIPKTQLLSKLLGSLSLKSAVASLETTIEDNTMQETFHRSPSSPSIHTFSKFREAHTAHAAQRKMSLMSRCRRRLSSLTKADTVEEATRPASVDKLFQVKFKNVKTIAPRQQTVCPQCGIQAEFDRCHSIPVEILLNSLKVRAKIHAIEHPSLRIDEGYMPLWEIDQDIARLYSCVALFDETLADVIQVSGPGSRAKTISLSEWLAFCRKSKMYDKLPITKNEVIQIFEDANRCDFLSDDNQFEMTIEEFCQALIFVAQKTGYVQQIDRLNAPLAWKLFPDGDIVRCVRSMLEHLDIKDNPDFILASFCEEGPASYILQRLKERDLSKRKWIPANEVSLQEKIKRENFFAKVFELFASPNRKSSSAHAAKTRSQTAANFVVQYADMIITIFYVHYMTPFEDGCREARVVQTLFECTAFMSCEFRVCELCILQVLGVFVSDNATGMSLQQQAERSISSRSPSKSPKVSSGFSKEFNTPADRAESPVPRLNLSPNALRKCIAQAQERCNTASIHTAVAPFDQQNQHEAQALHLLSSEAEVTIPFSSAVDLRVRRERLLKSLLQNEKDSKCARNECLDIIDF